MKKSIQEILDEQRSLSKIHQLSEGKINRTLANQQKGASNEFKQTMVKVKTGKKRPDMVGENNPGKTPAERKRRSERFLGKKKPKSQIENWKIAYAALPMIVCPHCKFEGKNQGNMNRYHFDKCKHKT